MQTVEKQSKNPIDSSKKLAYGNELKEHLADIQNLIEKDDDLLDVPSIWTAVKLLEKDSIVIKKVQKSTMGSQILVEIDKVSSHLHDIFDEGADEVVANARYAFIDGLVAESVKKPAVEKETTSDKIDKIVTNRILAPFIFFGIMFLLFSLTFTIATPFCNFISGFFDLLAGYVINIFGEGYLSSFLAGGSLAVWGELFHFYHKLR